MVRGKTQMKRIENAASRQVTFTKRRNGLLKKAYELSVLCDTEVGLMIFSPNGKLHEFASSSMQKLLEKYQKCSQEGVINNTNQREDIERLKQKLANVKDRIQNYESTQRNILGEGLASCSMTELNQLESQVERGLRHIRDQKTKIMVDEIGQLKSKERFLSEENAFIRKKVGRNMNT